MLIKLGYAFAFLLIAFGLLYHFIPLETFNFLVPKDQGSKLLKSDVTYGPDARNTMDVYVPTEGQGPWPVIVFVHGGSWSSGNKTPYEFVGRGLAAQNYLTLVINYRLHPQDQFPAFVEDTALAIDWATRHAGEYGGDPKHVFAMGHSAGGYNVALALLDKRYLAKLGTNVSAIKAAAILAAPLDFLPLDSPITIDVFGKVPNLTETQPISFVRKDVPPFLFLHGEDDTTCLPKNSINMDKALRAAAGSSTLKVYSGMSHISILGDLAKPTRGRSTTFADVIAFFRSQL
jgi:acetyl esterase/lipase